MEPKTLTLTIVYDNNAYDPRLRTAWGFSCLIECQGQVILFDTGGDSPTLLANMATLGIDPSEIETVVLSHIHGDHTDGLSGLLPIAGDSLTVFVPRSFPARFKEAVRIRAQLVEVREPREIGDRVYTTGELGTGIIEQSLMVRTDEGLVVVTGCAHPGIVEIVRKAKALSGDGVYLVLGGFHLGGKSRREIEGILSEFRRLGVRKVAPCHCTGEQAIRMFRQEYGEDFIQAGAGKVIRVLPFQILGGVRGFKKAYWPEPTARWWGSSYDTVSAAAAGFGPSVHSATPHRIWEYALNLEEIGADPTTWWGLADRPPVVRMGLRINSLRPPFTDQIPVGRFGADMSFADLLEISLATQPDFPAAQIGPVFFGVGLIPYRSIDPGTGHATTEKEAPLVVSNAAFGGRLDVLGDIGQLWDGGVRRYKIKYSQDGGAEQDLRQTWTNYKRELVAGEWEDVLYSIGPDADGIYDLPDPNDDWLTANLLLRWQTRGFGGGNGLYTVRLVPLPEELGRDLLQGVPEEDQLLNLAIDNTRPMVDILEMTHRVGGVEEVVERCAIVKQGTGGFRFHIKVDDPEGHLLRYSFVARYGDPGDPADPIPKGSQTYNSAVHGPSWNGVDEWVPYGDAVWRARESCAYGFHLGADARIINGYCWVYQDVWCSKYVTILVG